jgi:hypothetical protein
MMTHEDVGETGRLVDHRATALGCHLQEWPTPSHMVVSEGDSELQHGPACGREEVTLNDLNHMLLHLALLQLNQFGSTGLPLFIPSVRPDLMLIRRW